MPEGVELYSTEKKNQGWIVGFKVKHRKEDYFHQIVKNQYYDKNGEKYTYNSWSTGMEVDEWSKKENQEYYLSEIRLTGYHQDEVWLSPAYSHEWKADEKITVVIK